MRAKGLRAATDYDRAVVCEVAARIMAEQGVRDYLAAKEKALERLRLPRHGTTLPTNRELDAALAQRLRMFEGDSLHARRNRLIKRALAVMEWLSPYHPRLVGALLRDTVTECTPIEIHAFADTPEQIDDHLRVAGLDGECFDRKLRIRSRDRAYVPGFRFVWRDAEVEILVFGWKDIREAPMCPVELKPMQRMGLEGVMAMSARIANNTPLA